VLALELKLATVEAGSDPGLVSFLAILERHMTEHPRRLQPVDARFIQCLQALTADVVFDLDAPLFAECE
jgi:hypothetical protein